MNACDDGFVVLEEPLIVRGLGEVECANQLVGLGLDNLKYELVSKNFL